MRICSSEKEKTPGSMSFCLWSLFPSGNMETFKRDRVCQGEGYHVSCVFFKVHGFIRKMLDDSLFSVIRISTDQVNLCMVMPSWEWAPAIRCLIEISVASSHQFVCPIFVHLSLISSSMLNFYLIKGQSLLQSSLSLTYSLTYL